MNSLAVLLFPLCLCAQDPPAQVKTPKPAAEASSPKPKARVVPPAERQARREKELEKRTVQAERLALDARAQKKRALQEKARQDRFKKAEAEQLGKADKARRGAQEAQHRAEAHRRKAEEIRAKAEASWKAYQATLKPAEAPKAKTVPAAPKKTEETTKEEEVVK